MSFKGESAVSASKVKRMRKIGAMAVAATAAITLSACGQGASSAEGGSVTLTVATAATEGTPNAAVQDWFFEEVESRSEGRLSFDVLPTDALCAPPEVVVCVQDGRADVGISIPDYTPQLFPTLTIVGLPFSSENSQGVMQALYELHSEHEGAQKFWDQQGLTPIAHWSVGRLALGSKEPVESVDEVAGKRWRLSGPNLQAAAELAGGTNVALTAPETYEGIERGVADAVGFALDGPVNFKLMELLPYWTDAGTGHYSTFGMWFNKGKYDGLPEDLRAIVEDVQRDLNGGEGVKAFSEGAADQCQQMLDSPDVKDFSRWSEEASQEWEGKIGDQLKDKWLADAAAAGLEDPQSYLDGYLQKLDEAGTADLITDPVIDCVDKFAAR